MSVQFKPNRFGVPIYKNPNWDCEFYYEPQSNKKSDAQPFPTCNNPWMIVQTEQTHQFITGCPRPCPAVEFIESRKQDLNDIKEMIKENNVDGYLMLPEEDMAGIKKKLNDPSMFDYYLKHFGYKEIEADYIEDGNILFTIHNGD